MIRALAWDTYISPPDDFQRSNETIFNLAWMLGEELRRCNNPTQAFAEVVVVLTDSMLNQMPLA